MTHALKYVHVHGHAYDRYTFCHTSISQVLSYYYRFYFEETPVIIAERGHHLVST